MKYNRIIYEQIIKTPSKGKQGGIHHRRVRKTLKTIGAEISPKPFANGPDGFLGIHPIEVGSGNRKQFLSQSKTCTGKSCVRKNKDPNIEKIIDNHLDGKTHKVTTLKAHRELARTIPNISSHVSFNTDRLGGSTLLVHQPKGEEPRAIFMDKIADNQPISISKVKKKAARNESGGKIKNREDAIHKRIKIKCNDKPGGIFHKDSTHSEHIAVGLKQIQKIVNERTKIIKKKTKTGVISGAVELAKQSGLI